MCVFHRSPKGMGQTKHDYENTQLFITRIAHHQGETDSVDDAKSSI